VGSVERFDSMGSGHSKPQRRNTNNSYNNLQYHTDRGNIPAGVLHHQANRAPAPGTRTRTRFPHEYRNAEGPAGLRQDFYPDEVRRAGGQLYEVPVLQVDPRHRNFDYQGRMPNAQQMARPVHRNDHRQMFRATPRNDPGPVRAVVDRNGRVVGAMAHPNGNVRGFNRAYLEPMDRQGRQDHRRHQDRTHPRVRGMAPLAPTASAATWPPR